MTAREAQASALRTTVLEQKAILDHAPLGIGFTKAGVLMECNVHLADMVGYRVADLVGRDLGTMFPSSPDFQHLRDEALGALAQGGIYERANTLSAAATAPCSGHACAPVPWCRDGARPASSGPSRTSARNSRPSASCRR
nr:hypothetical protein [Massilia sp. Dwa41.01b]